MTRRRRPITETDTGQPLVGIWSPPEYRPENPARVDAASRSLADVLNGLHQQLEMVIAELSPCDIEALMSRTSLETRGHVLRMLGMRPMTPRTVGHTLCLNILARLKQVHLLDARHALQALTLPHQAQMEVASASHEQPDSTATASKGITVQDCPSNLCRLTFWANVSAGVIDARWITWATRQSWWSTESMSDHECQNLMTAAQAVIDASPDFRLRATPPHGGGHVTASGDATADSPDTAASSMTDVPPSGVPSSEGSVLTHEPGLPDDPDELLTSARNQRELLTTTHSAAVVAVRRLVGDV